ncbi:TPA: nicotinamide mononucleotide transporter [Streptococcus pneumoniae]|nr:nicotinamide mononucleotide transporter [Streptococcus pneumoniae]
MKKSLKIFATSKWFDLFGVALVVGIAIASGYLNSRLDKFVDWGPWTALVPFGLISVTNVGISMLSTRFTGKLSKWGNYFSIVNTILSGAIDYILGNKAAIITYPVTFLIYTFAIKKWKASQEGRPNQMSQKQVKLAVIIISIIAFLFAFALSLIANALNALKLTTQWGFWLIYNFVQLTKAGIQGNFANIGKYIFYILNAIGALFVWNDEEVR